jgi:hypothetical protein
MARLAHVSAAGPTRLNFASYIKAPITYSASQIEAASALDTVSVTAQFKSTISETYAALDHPSAAAQFKGSLSETYNANDTTTVSAQFKGSISEGYSATDHNSVQAAFTTSLHESYSALDTPSAQAAFHVNVGETYSALDSPNGGQSLFASIAEHTTLLAYGIENASALYATEDAQFIYAVFGSPSDTVDAALLSSAFGGKQLFEAEWLKPDSSNIDIVRYDKNTGEMQVKFKSGPTYRYQDVAPSKFKGLSRARSAGSYMANKIIPKYPGKRL